MKKFSSREYDNVQSCSNKRSMSHTLTTCKRKQSTAGSIRCHSVPLDFLHLTRLRSKTRELSAGQSHTKPATIGGRATDFFQPCMNAESRVSRSAHGASGQAAQPNATLLHACNPTDWTAETNQLTVTFFIIFHYSRHSTPRSTEKHYEASDKHEQTKSGSEQNYLPLLTIYYTHDREPDRKRAAGRKTGAHSGSGKDDRRQ